MIVVFIGVVHLKIPLIYYRNHFTANYVPKLHNIGDSTKCEATNVYLSPRNLQSCYNESRYFLNAGNCLLSRTVDFSPRMNASSRAGILTLPSIFESTVSLNLAG